MIEYTRNIIDELCRELEEREEEDSGKSASTRQSITLVVSAIDLIKTRLNNEPFKSQLEEIEFFKIELPRLLSLLIYYVNREKLELLKACQMNSLLEQSSNALMATMDEFFRENLEFMRYWRSGSEDRDHLYFLHREESPGEIYDPIIVLIDPKIYRTYSARIANFLAYEKLVLFIRNGYSEEPESLEEYLKSAKPMQFTGTDSDFTELVYALAETGVINHGTATKIEIARFLCRCFGKKLINISSTFQKLSFRNNELAFLERSLANVKKLIVFFRESRAKKNLEGK